MTKDMEGLSEKRLFDITQSPNGSRFAYEHRSMASELLNLRKYVEHLEQRVSDAGWESTAAAERESINNQYDWK